ncbi:hypothetical protein EFP65_14595 [Lacticaseibacillus paracasei]|nr:hypothetical protein F8272_04190 [Lacticaseibacillus paracasei]MCT3333428.1 hypothetical protein [Lacticaseibacillus paracasei]
MTHTGLLTLSQTRSQAQKPAHKDLGHKWPKPSHLCPRPLMLRFLTGLAHALYFSKCPAYNYRHHFKHRKERRFYGKCNEGRRTGSGHGGH